MALIGRASQRVPRQLSGVKRTFNLTAPRQLFTQSGSGRHFLFVHLSMSFPRNVERVPTFYLYGRFATKKDNPCGDLATLTGVLSIPADGFREGC